MSLTIKLKHYSLLFSYGNLVICKEPKDENSVVSLTKFLSSKRMRRTVDMRFQKQQLIECSVAGKRRTISDLPASFTVI